MRTLLAGGSFAQSTWAALCDSSSVRLCLLAQALRLCQPYVQSSRQL